MSLRNETEDDSYMRRDREVSKGRSTESMLGRAGAPSGRLIDFRFNEVTAAPGNFTRTLKIG